MFIKDYNKTAFIFDDQAWTYRLLIEDSTALAARFKIQKGDTVCIFAPNSPQWIIAFYAIWHNHGVSVPLDNTLDADDLAHVLKDCRPAYLFCTSDSMDVVKEASASAGHFPVLLNLNETDTTGTALPVTGPFITVSDPDNTAIIMYTSGTTGRPRGVMLSYDNLLASIQGLEKLNMLVRDDILYSVLPFYHIFPFQGSILAPLYIGATVVMNSTLTSESILASMERHRPTMFLGVPRLYEMFHAAIMKKIKEAPAGRALFAAARAINSNRLGRIIFGKIHRRFGGNIHAYLTGGARLEPEIAGDLWALGFRLVEGYGSTETAPLIAFNPFKRVKLGSVGLPMEGTEVEIRNGEILVRGRNVMKGYLNRPEETDEALRDGWFHTGDCGFFDRDGYLTITGRKDELIVLPNGKNINPEEIEHRIMSMSPLIREIGVIHESGQLMALVYPDFALFQKESIINILETIKWNVIDRYNRTVSHYRKILTVKLVREEFPRTRLGKLKRYMLIKHTEAEHGPRIPDVEPSWTEYSLLKSFLQNLKEKEVHPDDHLELDIGIDSLDRVELHAYIESTFGITLSSDELSGLRKIADLAELIRERKTRIQDEDVNWSSILSIPCPETLKSGTQRSRFLKQSLRWILNRYFFISASGMKNIPDPPFIIVANHQSYLDVLLLAAYIPERVFNSTFFMVKKTRYMSRMVRFISRGRNIILIDIEQDLKGSIRKAAAVLKQGHSLVIFPEGVRSRNGIMGRFKKSFAILARETGVPILPLAISGAYQAFPAGSFFPSRGRISIRFLKSIHPKGRSYEDIRAEARSIISDNIIKVEAEK